jgi:RNA polymerase sigma-70 factor (ECF subfamily)
VAPNTPKPTDAELVRRCLAGEATAWELFVDRFSGLVYFAILHALGGRSGRRRRGRLPDDLVGEIHNQIFLGLMEDDGRRLGRWHGRSKLSHWIKVVSVNRTIDFLRAQRPTLPLDDPDGPGAIALGALAHSGPDPEQAALRAERARVLGAAVGRLAPHDQDLVRLIYVEGWSGEDVARELGTTVGAIYTRKNRIRKRLRRLLSAHSDTLCVGAVGRDDRWQCSGQEGSLPDRERMGLHRR